MMIKYNDTNVHALPYVTYRQARIKNKRTGKVRIENRVDENQSPQDIKWLMPGWNEFPKAVWDQNKDHPGIKKMMRDGKIELMAETIIAKEGKKKVTKIVGIDDEPIAIRDFSEARAIEITKGTLNREILQRWLDEETRHKVKRALVKQIEPLLNPQKDDDGE